MMPSAEILVGDCLEHLRKMLDESVHCCVTSPPYWGLRDYGNAAQIGLESTPEAYTARMVEVFREVRRVLRGDGTLWLNLGDSYVCQPAGNFGKDMPKPANGGAYRENKPSMEWRKSGLKHKNLVGIPWRLAFALQADGWWLRQDIIWAKPNPMPESVTDRCTKAHEYVFMLSKSARYHYDQEALKEASDNPYTIDCIAKAKGIKERPSLNIFSKQDRYSKQQHGITRAEMGALMSPERNRRSVWTIATQPYPEAHFATYPEELPRLCIMAGTSAKGCCPKCGSPWERVTERGTQPSAFRANLQGAQQSQIVGYSKTVGWKPSCKCYPKDPPDCFDPLAVPCTVLDPFAGSGTTGKVAIELGRNAVLIELNPEYAELCRARCHTTPGFPNLTV